MNFVVENDESCIQNDELNTNDQLDMQKTPLEMLKKIAGESVRFDAKNGRYDATLRHERNGYVLTNGWFYIEKVPLSALRSHLGGMGLSAGLALQPIYTMSGGQKSRVSFAMITWYVPLTPTFTPRPWLILNCAPCH